MFVHDSTQRTGVRLRALRMAAMVAAFAALYTAGALVTYWYLTLSGASASFFPPAGLTLAVLMITPRRTWPVWLGSRVLASQLMNSTMFLATSETSPICSSWNT